MLPPWLEPEHKDLEKILPQLHLPKQEGKVLRLRLNSLMRTDKNKMEKKAKLGFNHCLFLSIH